MKQLLSFLALFILSAVSHAQEKLMLKQGNRLQYTVSVNGQNFPMFLRLDQLNENNCIITWLFEDGRSGRFVMGKSSLDSANHAYWNPPINGEELLLPSLQNVLFLSHAVFSSLQKNNTAVFDEYTVRVRPPAPDDSFRIKDQMIDVLYLNGEPGTKIWVLNNETTPLILKIEGNPYGVEVELVDIQ